MSRSYWLPIIALGGCLAATLWPTALLAQQEGQGIAVEEPAPQGQPGRDTSQNNNAHPSPQATNTLNDLGADEPPCGERCEAREQRERDDLEAQQTMARAAQSAVTVAWAQFVVGIFGVILVGLTARYAYRAAIAAESAVIEARRASAKTIVAMRKATKRQLQAYIDIPYAGVLDGHTPAMSICLKIKNAGQTPANNIIVYNRIEFRDGDGPPSGPLAKEPSVFSVGPHGMCDHLVEFDRPPTQVQLDAITAGGMMIFLYGEIRYSTAFGERKIYYFRLSYGSDNVKTGSLRICYEGHQPPNY